MSQLNEIPLPNKPRVIEKDGHKTIFEIAPCYPGYGLTLGNALRRVLLSSLPGAAVTAVKINGVNHEFSAIPYVMEDVVDITLNLKQLRFKMFTDKPIKIYLKAEGEKEVKAKDIKTPSDLKIINKDLHLVTLTDKKAKIEAEIHVEKGLGYLPVEQQQRKKTEIGLIAVDAIFTPIRRINYRVENMRVGKMTDYNRLLLEIETDGSITAEEAIGKAANILVGHFKVFKVLAKEEKKKPKKVKKVKKIEKVEKEDLRTKPQEDPRKTPVRDLNISTRIINILEQNRIKTVASLTRKTEESLSEVPGLGPAAVKEIRKEIGKLGLVLKE